MPKTPRSRRPATRSPSPSPPPPTAHELLAAPELAIFVALHQLLELANVTLLALHPELVSEPSLLRPPDPQAILADHVLRHSARLATAMTRYCAAVLAALHHPDTSDDLPF